ncbi:MAG: tetratricopeptide repeat protein [Gammaproteobacteria bacterium]|nr:tetratricopeptide repeat protein [Gammaproteobacteria bacterium]MBT8150656.1 tetratricopeptide repeat protein [Gammaproteobacteria bacterium]
MYLIYSAMKSKNKDFSAAMKGVHVSLLAMFIFISSFLFQAAHANEAVQGISKRIYRYINDAQKLIDEKQYRQALPRLEKARDLKLTAYEQAVVLNMIGYVHYQNEDLQKALQSYAELLKVPRLPDSMARNTYLTISQLNLVAGDYVKAEESARLLLKSPGRKPPPPSSSVILAQSLMGQERFEEALEPLLFAISEQKKAGANVRENWLATLSSIYFNLEKFEEMRDVLYELISINPKKQYLINLAAIHGQLGEKDKQLALIEALNDDNRLSTQSQLLTLANLFMVQQLPFKAAALLEREISNNRVEKNERNLQFQSQAWYLAGEYRKAVPPLEEAARMSGDGELWLRIARLEVALYEWERAEVAAKAAIEKGGLKNPGSALILEGMALAYQGKFYKAKRVLRQAVKLRESEKWAKQWLAFVDNEQKRLGNAR